jgi:initiation factor 1A
MFMPKKYEPTQEELEIARIRIPREGEVLGAVEMMLGGDKLKVICDDGNVRICRIPGRLRKKSLGGGWGFGTGSTLEGSEQ